MKIHSRKFEGHCARHIRYNPAVDGRNGIKGGCLRCNLLADIWETALRLNGLIRRFDPAHDESGRPPLDSPVVDDSRQLSLLIE